MIKRCVPCLVVAFAVVASTFVSAQQAPNATSAIVSSYLEIHAALASDRVEGARAPARALAATAAALGADGATLAKAASAVQAAPDLKAARDAFAALSDAVIARVKGEGSKEGTADLRLAYCPMVKRSWLQKEGQIRNPYYGSTMLTCGEFKPLR